MSELRVPTVALEAEVVCADGRAFRGRVFVPSASPHHPGPMRVTDWMNDRTPFFAFRPSEGDAFIMNKDEVVALTVDATVGEDPFADFEGSPRRGIAVECRDRVFRGEVVIDMPAGQQRLTDHLNRPETFLILQDGEKRHLVRKTRITRIVESA